MINNVSIVQGFRNQIGNLGVSLGMLIVLAFCVSTDGLSEE